MERIYPCELKLNEKCPWPSVKLQSGSMLYRDKYIPIESEVHLSQFIPASSYWEFKESEVEKINKIEYAEELFKLKKAELIEKMTPIAKEKGITGFKTLKKQDLINLIIENE